MDMFDEESGGRTDIPGLPESERGNKKGKKKGAAAAKKTLSLQNFLQDENQEGSNNEDGNNLETHMVKLNLDEEELIVMESCHSYIHDMLRHLGPTHATDPILLHEINKFPDEAKKIIQKCGGYRNFILRSKDLAVVDKIVAAKSDLRNAQEMAFKDIFNSLPATPRNDNLHMDGSKEIWNSNKSNLNKQSGNNWGAQEQLQQEAPRVDSLFNGEKGSNGMYYQTPPLPGQHQAKSSAQQAHGYPGDTSTSAFTYTQGGNSDERLWKLQEENKQLLQRAADRDQLEQEVKNLRTNFANLEALQHNTKNDLMAARTEVEKLREELNRVKAESSNNLFGDGQRGTQEMILSLKKSLEAEQLKSMTLAQELEMKKSSILDSQQPPGFFSSRESMIPRGPWQNAVPPPDISTSDGDLLGLRSMVPGPWSGEIVPSKPSTAQSLLPPSSSQGSSFLQSSHRGAHDLFGGLGLGSTSEFQSILGLPRSGSPPGLIGLSAPLTAPSPPPKLPSPPTVPKSPPPVAQPPPSAAPAGKTARQEMLVKKLVTLLPPGTSEETIKKSITVLRAKNGKLSGWPTSKIASAINELIQGGEV